MSEMTTQQYQDIAALLGEERKTRRAGKYVRWIGAALVLILAVALATFLMHPRSGDTAQMYRTDPVVRGDLNVAVSATGNLAPKNKVDIGSELSGTVETVLVQENDRVKKGQVLARLDTSKLKDETTRSEASLAAALGKLAQTDATLKEAQASIERFREVERLSGGKVPSKSEMTTAEATLARAVADQASQRAAVSQAQAELSSARTNLNKASIRSPIDGVVLTRSVEPGQTVAASLQVTTLFTVAEDLREMELKVNVDEADVGSVKAGQRANFTVDAYPGRKYTASVTRVAYGSQTKDNVVSYSTVLTVKNDDLSLRPGMTATAAIASLQSESVLLVPNTALRFTPAALATRPADNRSLIARLMPGPPPGGPSQPASTSTKGGAQRVWLLRSGQLSSVPVTVGASDGRLTEVTAGELQEGMQLVSGMAAGR